jgi:hypothetical protein
MLAGRKSIECRLSSVCKAPFKAVSPGDMLWLKPPSQPIRAVARAGACRFIRLTDSNDVLQIAAQHGRQISAPAAFFESARAWAKFASLIWIESVVSLAPLSIIKRDQRAWVVLDGPPRPGKSISPAASLAHA